MDVKVLKLSPWAVTPFRKFDSDYCYDVVAISEEEVAPNVWKYGLGLAFQIERGENENIAFAQVITVNGVAEQYQVVVDDYNVSIDFRPRSSVWKTGMVLSNCEGTIDEGYTGEVSAVFYHVMPKMPRYKVGDKIGQIKIGIAVKPNWKVVDCLDKTERGSGGYGSTGK